jgi:hypothetical protein
MLDVSGKMKLMLALKSKAAALGVSLQEEGDDHLKGVIETIKAKWFLGSRKVVYRMSLRLAEAEHAVFFREAVAETSWGLPPPTLTVQTETVSGWKRSGQRKDVSVGGGGTLDYARVRNAIEQAATDAGWQFRLEGGRLP